MRNAFEEYQKSALKYQQEYQTLMQKPFVGKKILDHVTKKATIFSAMANLPFTPQSEEVIFPGQVQTWLQQKEFPEILRYRKMIDEESACYLALKGDRLCMEYLCEKISQGQQLEEIAQIWFFITGYEARRCELFFSVTSGKATPHTIPDKADFLRWWKKHQGLFANDNAYAFGQLKKRDYLDKVKVEYAGKWVALLPHIVIPAKAGIQ
jgi:hypothetical protein